MTDSLSSAEPGRRRPRRVMFAALAFALIVGGLSYMAGYHRGLARPPAVAVGAPVAQGVPTAPGPAGGAAPMVYPYGPWHGHGPRGGWFGPVAFLLFGLVAIRMLAWGGPWGHRRYACQPWTPGPLDEWHRRAHERMTPHDPTPPPDTAGRT